MAKAHRLLLDRVSGYAEEAAAFMRRRRATRRPFARVTYSAGRSIAFEPGSETGDAFFAAATEIEQAVGTETPDESG